MRISRKSGILGFVFITIAVSGFHCKSTKNDEEDSQAQGLFSRKKDVLVLPKDYESFSADKKAAFLFAQMERTQFSDLPALEGVNPLKFIFARLMLKMDLDSDEAPSGYEKSIHAHGVAAKVEWEALPSAYT